ncbi:MAG TPA: DUF1003 domain-containing protein [Solirubrobacteraceae bacterium]|jgi:uncharacterized membrane protein|nr:DUF1003 domain-containing protein [Solirubrobacteraceae bacterium]
MARTDKLSQPRGTPVASGYDSDSFARWAESVARFFGTGRYLAVQTMLVAAWIAVNVVLTLDINKHAAFDPYPFILLNLVFSTQAAYAAPLILLAQNRQADRDKEDVERDRATNARALAETEFLARELAGLRLMLEQKADRDDVIEPIERLTRAVEHLSGVVVTESDGAESDDDGLSEPGDYSAESSHQ